MNVDTLSTGDSLTLGMHEMTRRLATTETATDKPARKNYPLSRSGMLKLFKNLASPGKQREAPASPQAAEELKIGKLDTQHPCKIKVSGTEAPISCVERRHIVGLLMIALGLCSGQILLLPERKVSAVRRRAHDEAMAYVLANNLSGTKRRKKRKHTFT